MKTGVYLVERQTDLLVQATINKYTRLPFDFLKVEGVTDKMGVIFGLV